jgi:YcaO-like protein with predicted kinase domain
MSGELRHCVGETTGEPVPKGYCTGTHRLVSPQETIARTRLHLEKIGITRIANITGLDVIGIPVVMAVRPNARSVAVAQGKGLTLDAAKASALMESIEAYHAERISLPLQLASYQEMAASCTVADVDSLLRLFNSRYQPCLPLLWIEGQDWVRHEPVWVPYQVVHTAYTVHLKHDLGSFFASTSGLASGNHLLEAVSHGICELVERDATTLMSLEGEDAREGRRVDLGTVNQSDCQSVLGRFERAQVSVGVWETTRDIRIPSFQCVIVDREDDPSRGLYAARGSGCHPARHIALLRALTEAAQSRLTVIAGSRDDQLRSDYREMRDPQAIAWHRRMNLYQGDRNFLSAPTFEADSFEQDVAWELDRVRDAGLSRVIVVDLTKADIGLPVARVIIPGLESSVTAGDCMPGVRARRLIEARR